jgi:hypothetical protein
MLEKIRLATPEEVAEIEHNSNLTAMSKVLVMGDMRAVWRVAHELDPVHFNGAPTTKMYKFLWGIENIMRGAGCTEYFYNTPADDPAYHRILEELGAQRTSKQPDYRWKVNL